MHTAAQGVGALLAKDVPVAFRVVGAPKAGRLGAKLTGPRSFGGVIVRTRVVPADEPDAFRAVFDGNEAVRFVERRDMLPMLPRTLVVFDLEDDDIPDRCHVRRTLMEDAARTVLLTQGSCRHAPRCW